MIVLHLAACHTGLAAWAETSKYNPSQAIQGNHPFTTSAAELHDWLEAAGVLDAQPSGCKAYSMRITLPSDDKMPLPSTTNTIENLPAASPGTGLRPWRIQALMPSNQQCVELMKICRDEQRTTQHGMEAGTDAKFWARAIEFALEITASGQFLPIVEQDTQHHYARWQPIIEGRDASTFDQLAAQMPASGRAISHMNRPEDNQLDARTALRTIIERMVDETVRTGLEHVPTIMDTRENEGHRERRTHDDLVDALTKMGNRRLTGSPSVNSHIATQVEEWRQPLRDHRNAPARLCVELEPPKNEEGHWLLHLMLQAKHNHSLLVNAARIWEEDVSHNPLTEPGFRPRRFMHEEIQRTAKISEALRAATAELTPHTIRLDNEQAHHFITEEAIKLAENGVIALLPQRLEDNRQLQIRATIEPKTGAPGHAGLAAITELRWSAMLGNLQISAQEMERLAESHVPLVRLRNQWVNTTDENISDAINHWKNRPRGRTSALEALSQIINPSHDEEYDIRPGGWLRELVQQLQNPQQVKQSKPPTKLNGILRPYQHRGYSWIRWLTGWGLGACLADDMGLGKTIQALAMMLGERADQKQGRFLIVCPASLVGNWQREAARFAPSLRVLVHHGTTRARSQRELQSMARHAHAVIITYGTLQKDAEMMAAMPWRAIVLDEAQNIKNPSTSQAKAVKRLQAPCRIALTGTPVENNVGDLWSIMDFLNPGLLGSRQSFRKMFLLPIQRGDEEVTQHLQRICAPFILRRMKTDPDIAPELPEKFENRIQCTLTKEQASLYGAVIKDLEEKLETAEGIERLGLIFSTTTKLKQVCNHPAQLVPNQRKELKGRSGKLTRLLEMVKEATQQGAKSLVFTQYVQMGHLLRSELERTTRTEVPFLHGSMTPRQRDRMVDRFQNDESVRTMIVSLKAGGNGLNLTAASHVFHYDRWWNPAVENQASDRAFRIGQTKNVQIHKMICLGTLEEKIDLMIEEKQELADNLIRVGDDWLANLPDHELREVLTLSQEAA